MLRLSRYLLGFFIALSPSVALADAATHELKLKLKTLAKTDCAGEDCVPACMVYASLATTKSGPKQTRALQVELHYRSKNTQDDTSITLAFDQINMGKAVETTGHAPGHACNDVKVKRVTIECFEEDRCPGFYYVQIPAVSKFGLKKHKVEAK